MRFSFFSTVLHTTNVNYSLQRVTVNQKPRCGHNLIGQRASIQVPGQCEGNISLCVAICEGAVASCRQVLRSYNSITFLNELEQACQDIYIGYVIAWHDVSFHHAELFRKYFQAHPQFMSLYFTPYSLFLNQIE